MTFQLKYLSAKIILLAALLDWAVWNGFDYREDRLRAEHEQLLANQQAVWAKEKVKRALDAKQKSVEMEKAYAQQLIKAFGGPIETAIKTPGLDIQHMLRQLAIASAPAGTEVTVTVSRFTEFDAALVLHQSLSFRQMAAITKTFLKNGGPYIHNLRFIQGNEVLAQLDDAAIGSIPDWNTASADSVQALLSAPETEFESTATTTAANDSNEDLSPDQIKINQVQRTFKAHFSEHVSRLEKVMADLDQTAQLDSVTSWDQLDTRITSLNQLASRLATERQFFLNQTAELEQLLNGQDLDPLLVTIMKRDMQNLNRNEAAILSDLFDSITAYQDKIKTFLGVMKSHWGEWTPEPATHQIRFTTADAQNTYSLAMIPVEASAQLVQANFRSWANYKPPK
jgi:hypothetical protein